MIDLNEQLSWLRSHLDLSLDNGIFITGSFLTHFIESEYRIPNWFPKDIDICCTSTEQFNKVKHVLEPLSNNTRVTNWLNTSSTYWTIDNILFQAFIHPISVQGRITWTDFSITSIASDGVNFLMQDDTRDDIKNKVLRYHDKINEYPRPIESMKDRYYKYLSRGYTDPDNQTLNKLTQLHEIWSTI